MRKNRPDIFIVLAVLIGLGVIVTKIAQAYTSRDLPVTTTVTASR